MILHTLMPLFTGPAEPEEMSRRHDSLINWLQSPGFDALKSACGERTSITAYFPGKELHIPHKEHPDAMKVSFPPNMGASVPKGFVARLHLLYLLYLIEYSSGGKTKAEDQSKTIFACIDGSGAFNFDSLTLLVEAFAQDPDVDVVLGRRPPDYSGMMPGRKEIEEFEQYLLFHSRPAQLKAAFAKYDLSDDLLPDGQAGCWAFRLRCSHRLPLTANGYEIEYDLLASAIESQLKIAYTEPLAMPRVPRHSGASTRAIEMSIRKLDFISCKLDLTREDIVRAWKEFASRFAGTDIMNNILPGYEEALLRTYGTE